MILPQSFRRLKNYFTIPNRNYIIPLTNNNEIVESNNRLNKELQQFLKPLNFIHNLYLLTKYKMRNNCITPNDFKSKAIASTLGLLLIILLIYEFLKEYKEHDAAKLLFKLLFHEYTNNVLQQREC